MLYKGDDGAGWVTIQKSPPNAAAGSLWSEAARLSATTQSARRGGEPSRPIGYDSPVLWHRYHALAAFSVADQGE